MKLELLLRRDPMKFYQTREFIKLQKVWKKKLERSGFNDLEPSEGDRLPAQFYVAREIKRPERLLSIQEYYCQASKFYWDYQFVSEREKKIWLYHSEGLAIRAIADRLRGENFSSIRKVLKMIEPVFLEYVKAQWKFDDDNAPD